MIKYKKIMYKLINQHIIGSWSRKLCFHRTIKLLLINNLHAERKPSENYLFINKNTLQILIYKI